MPSTSRSPKRLSAFCRRSVLWHTGCGCLDLISDDLLNSSESPSYLVGGLNRDLVRTMILLDTAYVGRVVGCRIYVAHADPRNMPSCALDM